MHLTKTKQQQNRGFNLIEAAIVLGVVGMVVGGIWVAASAVRDGLAVSTAQKSILSIANGVQNLYGPTAGYPTTPASGGGYLLLNTSVIAAGLVPADVVVSSSGIKILNGTGWSIYLVGPTSFATNSILFAGYSYSESQATKLLNSVIGAARGELLYADCYDGNVSAPSKQSWNGVTTNFAPPASPLICDENGTGRVSLGFYFKVHANVQ